MSIGLILNWIFVLVLDIISVKKNGEKTCYHLRSLKMAITQDKLELITFSDQEYEDFISGVLSDLQGITLDNKK